MNIQQNKKALDLSLSNIIKLLLLVLAAMLVAFLFYTSFLPKTLAVEISGAVDQNKITTALKQIVGKDLYISTANCAAGGKSHCPGYISFIQVDNFYQAELFKYKIKNYGTQNSINIDAYIE